MKNKVEKCADFLKEYKDSKRIMNKIRERYISLGTVGGTVIINNPSHNEKLFLRDIFKRDYSEHKSITISLKKFEEAFNTTAFEGVNLPDIIEAYFKESIVTNKVVIEEKERIYQEFFDTLLSNIVNKQLQNWIRYILENKTDGAYRKMMNIYYSSKEKLAEEIKYVDKAIIYLEQLSAKETLPIFATNITKDPHAFDEDKELFDLLMYFISWDKGMNMPRTAEEKTALLYEIGIIKDSGNTTIMTYGLIGSNNNKVHIGWEMFANKQEPLIVSLINLNTIDKINTHNNNQTIYCFENPSVFLELIKRNPCISAICTSGQINMAGYIVMDLLIKSGYRLSYSGDFDPEGLMIADKLKNRYKNGLELLGYDIDLYYKSISDVQVKQISLNKLNNINDNELNKIADELKVVKKAGYQERIVGELEELIMK